MYLSHMIRYHTALSMHCADAYVLKVFLARRVVKDILFSVIRFISLPIRR